MHSAYRSDPVERHGRALSGSGDAATPVTRQNIYQLSEYSNYGIGKRVGSRADPVGRGSGRVDTDATV